MEMIKRNVFGSGTSVFRNYDKLRRKQEFELLKDVCKYEYGIDNVYENCFEIPIFNRDKKKIFAIQMQNNQDKFRVAIYFKNNHMLNRYSKSHGEYTSYTLTLSETNIVMNRFIESMADFLGNYDLYFIETTEEELDETFFETEETYDKLKRGIY